MSNLTTVLKKGVAAMPLWTAQIPHAPALSALKNVKSDTNLPQIVYFPACISRTLGTYQGKEKNLMQTFLSVCEKAKIGVHILDNVSGSCCGQIFSSKGFSSAYQLTANKIVVDMWSSSREGQFPIVIDVSSCAYTLQHLRPALTEDNKLKFDQLKIMDSVVFLHDMVLPNAVVKTRKKSIVLHPVCSLEKMKTDPQFLKIAKHFSENVLVPQHSGCCGMAGDRGFLFPEFTESATHLEAQEIKNEFFEGYYSSTKTCEIALTDATKKNYESILYLIDEGI
jgi:D-lactate dehydrogenase